MKKINLKKLFLTFALGIGMTFTTVLGYATVTYVLDKVINQSVTVGETAVYTDGLFIELASYDNYTLTYFELDETETSKHYVTYVYNYVVLVEGKDIVVSSLTNNIVVTNLTSTETTISITFSLNQEKEYNEGDVLNIQFYFEAVGESLGGFTASNPLNINTATEAELLLVGFTEAEAFEILSCANPFTDLDDMNYTIYVVDLIARYSGYVELGIIVFN